MPRLPIDTMKELQQLIIDAIPEGAEFHLIVYAPDGTVNAVKWWDKDPTRILAAEREILERAGEGAPATTDLPAWLSDDDAEELHEDILDLMPDDGDYHLVVVAKDGSSCVLWWSEDPPMLLRLVREIIGRDERGEGESIPADSPSWFRS